MKRTSLGGGSGATTTASPYALAKIRAALAARRQRPCRIVMAGSSTTEGWVATNDSARYVNQFAQKIQADYSSGILSEAPVLTVDAAYAAPATTPGVHVYNAGVAGTSSGDYLTATTRTRVAALNPVAVIHMAGSNDFAGGVVPSTYKSQMSTQITALKAAIADPCVHVLVQPYQRGDVSSPAFSWAQYGDALRQLAAADPDNVVFVDLSSAYSVVGTPAVDPLGLFNSDTVHQDDPGHAFMADLLYDALSLPGAPADRYVLADSFTRPDNASSMGVTEIGGATWTTTSTWTITGKKAAPLSGASGNVFAECGLSDIDATAVITYTGSAVGLLFRASDDANRLGAFLDGSGGGAILYKADVGATSALSTTAMTLTSGVDYVVRVVAKGDQVRIYVDGVLKVSHTLSSANQTKYGVFTKVGFRNTGTNTTARWDSINVRAA